jgi:hypothetical protein
MRTHHVAALLGVAGIAFGCARDRDFAVVEPPLSRPYQATSALPASRVVGVQPVAGQAGVVQPVYQPQPAAIVPNQSTVALPPASSTGAVAADPAGQPYYAPPPLGVEQAPAPTVVSPPVAVTPSIQPTMAPASVPISAGVYPVGAGGMWTPASGNQQIAIHQFSTPSTGSSFVPSTAIAAGTPSSMQMSEGVVPAAAAVPFTSRIPVNAPPPQTTQMPFLSDTGEHAQGTRIPPLATAAAPVNPPVSAPSPRPLEGAPLPRPGLVKEPPRPKQPDPTLREPLAPEGVRPRPKTVPDPVPSGDDVVVPDRPKSAPSAEPPRTSDGKRESKGTPPGEINLPNDAKKGTGSGAPKKAAELDEPPAPKKQSPPPPKKQAKDDDSSPGMELPEDPPPPKKGSGS